MNEIGWWILALFAISALDHFLHSRDIAKGRTATEYDIGRAVLMLFLLLLWGGAGTIRLLFF